MDLLKDNIRQVFFRYLAASFGGALIFSVYSLVDVAMVGQYCGPDGVAALATVTPVWNTIISLGLLFGIGGAVLMSMARGQGKMRKGEQWYTTALIGAGAATVISWAIIFLFSEQLLRLFGADDMLLPLAMDYLQWIRIVVPFFVLGQFFAAFLRNDNAPLKATIAVVSGGVFNIVGDYVFVFVFDMGISGAGLATAIGQTITFCILLTHLFTKKNGLHLHKMVGLARAEGRVMVTGFPSFLNDFSVGIMTMLINNQAMKYGGSDVLAVYGVMVNIQLFAQSCAYGVGQAAQPLLSTNFGAGKKDRLSQTLRLGLGTAFVLTAFWVMITQVFPIPILRIFMVPTASVLCIAPQQMRTFFLCMIFLTFNVFSTYYFQSVLQPRISFVISVMRGLVLSGIFVMVFPALFGADALWLAVPMSEAVVAIGAIFFMKRGSLAKQLQ